MYDGPASLSLYKFHLLGSCRQHDKTQYTGDYYPLRLENEKA